MERLGRARAREVATDWAGARAIYAELWDEATRAADQYQACVVAHFMAHAHDEAEAQLQWHLRALHAADAAADAAAAQGDARVHDFYPSLRANLGDVYMRLGDHTQHGPISSRRARPTVCCTTTPMAAPFAVSSTASNKPSSATISQSKFPTGLCLCKRLEAREVGYGGTDCGGAATARRQASVGKTLGSS